MSVRRSPVTGSVREEFPARRREGKPPNARLLSTQKGGPGGDRTLSSPAIEHTPHDCRHPSCRTQATRARPATRWMVPRPCTCFGHASRNRWSAGALQAYAQCVALFEAPPRGRSQHATELPRAHRDTRTCVVSRPGRGEVVPGRGVTLGAVTPDCVRVCLGSRLLQDRGFCFWVDAHVCAERE
jgi:hypothetical protein